MQSSIWNFDRLSRASAFNTCGLDLPHVAAMHDRYDVTSWLIEAGDVIRYIYNEAKVGIIMQSGLQSPRGEQL